MESAITPLAKKLKLKPGLRAAVVGGPAGYLERLGPPEGTSISTTLDGLLDWVQVFVRTSAELAGIVEPLAAALSPTGLAWISYPKGSSKLQTDLTRDKGGESLEGSDLMWLSPVSIDETWSQVGLDGQALGKQGGDVSFESRGWSTATDRFSLELVGGSKSIDVVERPV